MPVKVQSVDPDKPPDKINNSEYDRRRHKAYYSGLMSAKFEPKYTFEKEEYERGYEQDKRVRDEIANGLR